MIMALLITLAFLALCVMTAPWQFFTRLALDWRFWVVGDLARLVWLRAVEDGHFMPANPVKLRDRLKLKNANPWAVRRARKRLEAASVFEHVGRLCDEGYVKLIRRAAKTAPMMAPPPLAVAAPPGILERDMQRRVRGAQLCSGIGQALHAPAPPAPQVPTACLLTGNAEEAQRKVPQRNLEADLFGSFLERCSKNLPIFKSAPAARVQPVGWVGEVCPESPMERAAWRAILARAARWGPCLPSTLATLAEYVRRRPQLAVAWVLHLDGNPKVMSPWGCLLHAIREGWAPPQRDEDAARPLIKPRREAHEGRASLGTALGGVMAQLEGGRT